MERLIGPQTPHAEVFPLWGTVNSFPFNNPVSCYSLPNVNQTFFLGNLANPLYQTFNFLSPHGRQNSLFPSQRNNILIMEIMASICEIMGSIHGGGEQIAIPSPLISQVGGPSLQGSPTQLSLSGDYYGWNQRQFSFALSSLETKNLSWFGY